MGCIGCWISSGVNAVGCALGSAAQAVGCAVSSVGCAVGSAVSSVANNPSELLALAAMAVAPELAPALIGATGSTMLGSALTGAAIGGGEGLINSHGCFCAALKGAVMGGVTGGVGAGVSSAFGGAGSAAAGASAPSNGLYGLRLGGYGGPAATYTAAGLCPTNITLGAAPASTGITSSLGAGFYCELKQPTCQMVAGPCFNRLGQKVATKLATKAAGCIMHSVLYGCGGAQVPHGASLGLDALHVGRPAVPATPLCSHAHILCTGPVSGAICGMAPLPSLYGSLTPSRPDPCTPMCVGCRPIVGASGAGTVCYYAPQSCRPIMGMHGALPAHAEGGTITGLGALAEGGLPSRHHPCAPAGHEPEFITGVTGHYARGRGTGQSDDIPAMLHEGDYVIDADAVASLGDGSSKAGAERLDDLRQRVPHEAEGGTAKALPAQIADGEYVFPAAFVTALGGGSNKRGADLLDRMREELRAHKRSAPDDKIPPKARSPLDYLKSAQER